MAAWQKKDRLLQARDARRVNDGYRRRACAAAALRTRQRVIAHVIYMR